MPDWTPVASKVDSHGAGIHPESTQQDTVIAWLFAVYGVDSDRGGLPKKML